MSASASAVVGPYVTQVNDHIYWLIQDTMFKLSFNQNINMLSSGNCYIICAMLMKQKLSSGQRSCFASLSLSQVAKYEIGNTIRQRSCRAASPSTNNRRAKLPIVRFTIDCVTKIKYGKQSE